MLKRDLRREQERLQAALASQPPSKPTSPVVGTTTMPTSPLQPTSMIPDQSPLANRRQSAVALSSLQRPAFPHKLDLSSLRVSAEDLISLSASGMPSPVTLAPRTARPTTATSEIPPDLMAAIASSEAAAASRPVDIDLTMDSESAVEPPQMNLNIDPALGGSADKPIELDLDIDMEEMTGIGIFGPEPSNGSDVENLFSPAETRVKVEEMFPDFSAVGSTGRDSFQSVGAATNQNSGHPHVAATGESPFDLNSIDLDQSFLLASNSDMTLINELFKSDPSASTSTQGTSGGTAEQG